MPQVMTRTSDAIVRKAIKSMCRIILLQVNCATRTATKELSRRAFRDLTFADGFTIVETRDKRAIR